MPIIATAAWSIPKKVADRFSQEGSGLTRYASAFDGVEINSTFYRRHKTSTFARWADSVPDSFRFAVKIPKEISHTRAMKGIAEPFEAFLEDIIPLGEKRGPLLCQLPPTLVFDADMLETAFKTMRDADDGPIVIEVRHKSWASAKALDLLRSYAIDRVLADPAPIWPAEDFDTPPKYLRLHGKPKIYYSSYTDEEIRSVSKCADALPSFSWGGVEAASEAGWSAKRVESAPSFLIRRLPVLIKDFSRERRFSSNHPGGNW